MFNLYKKVSRIISAQSLVISTTKANHFFSCVSIWNLKPQKKSSARQPKEIICSPNAYGYDGYLIVTTFLLYLFHKGSGYWGCHPHH